MDFPPLQNIFKGSKPCSIVIKHNGIQRKQQISLLCACWKKYYFQKGGIIVGHMPDLITSLSASVKAREYISLPSKWIIGWDLPLQEEKVLIVLIPSSLNTRLKIHFPQAKLELQDYGNLGIYAQKWTPKLSPLFTVWADPRALDLFAVSPCRQWERRSRWLALRLVFLL